MRPRWSWIKFYCRKPLRSRASIGFGYRAREREREREREKGLNGERVSKLFLGHYFGRGRFLTVTLAKKSYVIELAGGKYIPISNNFDFLLENSLRSNAYIEFG